MLDAALSLGDVEMLEVCDDGWLPVNRGGLIRWTSTLIAAAPARGAAGDPRE